MNQSNTKIAIDALGIDQPGGSRTAVLYLLDSLFQIKPDWQYIVYVSQKEALFFRYPHVQQIVLPVTKGIIARALIQLMFPLIIWKNKIDLVHFTKSQGAILFGVKRIVTLFDVTTLRYPGLHKPVAVWFWRYIQPIVARNCDAVITLSVDAARDIQQLLHVPEDKIYIIPCASQFQNSAMLSTDEFLSIKMRYNLPDEYMLFIGALARKKNISTLITALGLLKAQRRDFPPLLLVGPRYKLSDAGNIFSEIHQLNLEEHIRYLGPLPESELAQILHHARLFLLPSIHEGFGIPVLEAMACSTPVIASKASAIPEVVGDAGWLVEEYMSPQAWADSINRLLRDPALQAQLIEKGRHRVQDFSWNKSAQQLASVYEHLLSSRQVSKIGS